MFSDKSGRHSEERAMELCCIVSPSQVKCLTVFELPQQNDKSPRGKDL